MSVCMHNKTMDQSTNTLQSQIAAAKSRPKLVSLWRPYLGCAWNSSISMKKQAQLVPLKQ